jgi:hypothetical protein
LIASGQYGALLPGRQRPCGLEVFEYLHNLNNSIIYYLSKYWRAVYKFLRIKFKISAKKPSFGKRNKILAGRKTMPKKWLGVDFKCLLQLSQRKMNNSEEHGNSFKICYTYCSCYS